MPNFYFANSQAGFQLSSTKYIVLFSKKHIVLSKDFLNNKVKYHHVNIAVNPDSPSVSG